MKSQKTSPSPPKKIGGIVINCLGILSAFVFAFGGLFLVQSSLVREKDRLLAGGGLLELPQKEAAEATQVGEVFALRQLTEDELLQLIRLMEQKGDIRPHEPVQGQLTMAQAINYGQVWMEEFFLPCFGLNRLFAEECRINCYLWAPETAGAGTEEYSWLSCWTVSFVNQELEAKLLLSAVSGQVLDASVSYSAPVDFLSREELTEVLGEYGLTFGLESDYALFCSEETDSGAKRLPWYLSIGTKGIYAALDADSTRIVTNAVEDKNTGIVSYIDREYFEVRLYLCYEPEIPQP